MLYGSFHGSCAELRVVAFLGKIGYGVRRGFESEALLGKHLLHTVDLQPHYLCYLLLVQRQEHDGLVDTVEELWPYGLLQHLHELRFQRVGLLRSLVARGGKGSGVSTHTLAYQLASKVRRHDDDSVLEVHGASLVVGQPAVVEHLKQDVEHVGMSLLNLVEQHHAVWLAPYGLGELASLVVAHVARRCSDEPRHAELLLIFAHVDTRHHALVVEEVLGQSLCQLRLAHSGGSEEDERCYWSLRILQSGAAAAHCIAHGSDGFVLSHYAAVKLFL